MDNSTFNEKLTQIGKLWGRGYMTLGELQKYIRELLIQYPIQNREDAREAVSNEL